MQDLRLILIAMVLCLLPLSGCVLPGAESAPPATEPPVEEIPPASVTPPPPEPVSDAQFEVLILENDAGTGTTFDVYLHNIIRDEMTLYATVENAQVQHYHPAEQHNGHIYLILRAGDPGAGDNWTDELWKFSAPGEGTLIYPIKGLDFRVSPDESLIAVTGGDTVGEQLLVLDGEGQVLHSYTPDQVISGLGPALSIIQLVDWAADGAALWVTSGGPFPTNYTRIDTANETITIYEVVHLGPLSDAALNVNTGRLAFSDHPTFFDADSAQAFAESGTPVVLSVYDLETQASQVIAESVAKQFDPVWLDAITLEYNDPSKDGRVSQSVP
jgi:hypothetical protein